MEVKNEIQNPLLVKNDSDLVFLSMSPKDRVVDKIHEIEKIKEKNNYDVKERKKYSELIDKFWSNVLEDLESYERALSEKKPFEDTCYKRCPSCVRCWDKTYWEYMLVGLRRKSRISEFKNPVKNISVVLIFLSGLFKLIRANQDGKASFVGNILQIITNVLIIIILWPDRDWAFILPKFGAIVVSVAILWGILANVENGEIGI